MLSSKDVGIEMKNKGFLFLEPLFGQNVIMTTWL
jgi:hypothetical protein